MKNSRSTLLTTGIPLLLPDLLLDRQHDPTRRTKTQEHAPHMLRRYGELTRQLRKVWSELLCFTNLCNGRARMGVQVETSAYPAHYSNPTQEVKEIITNEVNAEPRPKIREALVSLRMRLDYTQRQMAELLGVSQAQIAKWENEKAIPPGQVFARLSEFAPADEKAWWLERAGLRLPPPPAEESSRLIPLLSDPASAGTPRALDERQISGYLSFPKQWLPAGGTLHAVEINGHSMEPVLCTGFIVIVDVDQRSAAKLVGHMVLAREDEGVTVKWLRKSGTMLVLVPENTSYPVQVIQPGNDIQIIGEVVRWIGHPAAPKKRK